jgi:hypothetical protein
MALRLGNWRRYEHGPDARTRLIAHGWSADQLAPSFLSMELQRTCVRVPRFTQSLVGTLTIRFRARRHATCLAFLMYSQPRLGQGSAIPHLPRELCAKILHAWTHPYDPPGPARTMPQGHYTQQALNGFTPHPAGPSAGPPLPMQQTP